MGDVMDTSVGKLDRRGEWFQTWSGIMFYPFDPNPEDIKIEDIAHSLARQCRYAGHCDHFYSVAQHSVMVAENVPPEHMFWGLMHDAAEAYCQDMIRPIKKFKTMKPYRDMEHQIEKVVAEVFGLKLPIPDCVKIADERALDTERRDLLKIRYCLTWPTPQPFEVKIIPWSCETAEHIFLTTFKRLEGARHGTV